MHTGDLATMDDEGYLNIVGRIKDMVIRGGENVYPREIEEFLYTHPAIADVQVIGVPDERYGEELCAWVIARPTAPSSTTTRVRDYCRGRMAHFKVPRYVIFVDEFPMTVTGKVRSSRCARRRSSSSGCRRRGGAQRVGTPRRAARVGEAMRILCSAWIVVALAVAGCAETAAAPERAGEVAPAPPTSPSRFADDRARPRADRGAAAGLARREREPHPPSHRSARGARRRHLPAALSRDPVRAHARQRLEALGPGDAFVTLEERGLGVPDGAADFPARPARFGPALGGPSEASACAPGARFSDHWFGFSDGGRHFHVLVAFGPQASAEVQRQAWAILDGLTWTPASRRIGSRAASAPRACGPERRRRRSSSWLSQCRAHDFSSASAGCSSLPMAVSP